MAEDEKPNTVPERIAATCMYHAEGTWDIVLDGVSMTLSLMIVGTWNAYLYGMFTRHVASSIPGSQQRGSLLFAMAVTLAGVVMFGVLGTLTRYKVAPKRVSWAKLTNPLG